MKLSFLALSVAGACLSVAAQARDYTFDASQLGVNAREANLALINKGGQLPGVYPTDILLNGDRVAARDVEYATAGDGVTLKPCLTVEELSRYGVRTDKYPQLASGRCADLEVIPGAKVTWQLYSQQLLLSIPQVALRPTLSGIAPQALWDDGIPALLMDYSANTSHTESRGDGGRHGNDSSYVQLNPGANLGAWRLRNQTNWSRQSDGGGKWQTLYTYAERGLYDWKSRLTLGDRSTPGEVFDGVPFRGVMLGSDENMVPYNQREFAPIVRGIARTQARVEVKQNGYTVYSQVVAPGAFELSDLSLAGGSSGGDLQVTVYETDGATQVFTVPFQSPAIALREGYLKYNVMTGRYRPASSGTGGTLGQATVMYGLPWNLTAYGGAQVAEHFHAASLGLGLSLGDWGAISLDGIGSRGQRKGRDTERGGAWRFRYSKDVVSTNTTLSMTSYQYASPNYNTLADVMDTWTDAGRDEWRTTRPGDRRKSQSALVINQSMGDWGSLGLNGSRTDYWNRPGYDDMYGASYGIGVMGASVTFGLSRTKQYNSGGQGRDDTTGTMFVSVPLSRWLQTGNQMNATYQLTSSKHSTSNEVGLNGWGFDRQMNWDVRERYRTGSSSVDHASSAARMNWYGRYGQAGGNYSYSPHQRQMGASVSGGMVVHRNGVTLGQTLGETAALVSAPGAAGVPVGGYPGVSTDFRGYTTRGWLTPYQENTISLDPTKLPADAEIQQTDVKVVPTQGAVIPATFITRVGDRALMTLTRNGKPLPFGAMVTPEGQKGGSGIVGDGGQVYLSGLAAQGELSAQWGDGQTCRMHYALPEGDDGKNAAGIYTTTGVCQ